MDIEQIRKVLERYTQGKCTEDEVRIIEQWFASVNRHRSAMIQEEFLQEQLEEVRMRLQEHIAAPPTPVVPLRARRWRAWAISGAAALMAGAIALFFLNEPAVTEAPAQRGSVAITAEPAKSNRVVRNGFVEITTAKGATEKIVLADGSTVNLNAGSRLRYPVTFSGPNRDIYLEEGEAFFKVAEDPSHPFIVHSRGLATTALGTSFNIRAYSREQRITVALLTGKVKVDHAERQETVILLPSEQLSFDTQSLLVAKSTFDREDDIVGWKHGIITFRDATYEEVARELEYRYNVTIVNETGNADWNYSGSFRDENVQEVIETICQIKNISYTLRNDTIFLTRKN